MKQRKVPLRKCVACHEMMPKKQLIRVVKTPEDEVLIDLTGKKVGTRRLLVRQSRLLQACSKKQGTGSGIEALGSS